MDTGDFKKSYRTIISIVRDGKGDLVADSNSIFLVGGTISLNYWMYMALKLLDILKYIHQGH